MSDTVVDSSVLVKWVLPEADSSQAQRLIAEVAMVGERLIVLDLAFAEAANAIWRQHHLGLLKLEEARHKPVGQVSRVQPRHAERRPVAPSRHLTRPGRLWQAAPARH